MLTKKANSENLMSIEFVLQNYFDKKSVTFFSRTKLRKKSPQRSLENVYLFHFRRRTLAKWLI